MITGEGSGDAFSLSTSQPICCCRALEGPALASEVECGKKSGDAFRLSTMNVTLPNPTAMIINEEEHAL